MQQVSTDFSNIFLHGWWFLGIIITFSWDSTSSAGGESQSGVLGYTCEEGGLRRLSWLVSCWRVLWGGRGTARQDRDAACSARYPLSAIWSHKSRPILCIRIETIQSPLHRTDLHINVCLSRLFSHHDAVCISYGIAPNHQVKRQ